MNAGISERDPAGRDRRGELVRRALLKLPFPFHLLDWPGRSLPNSPILAAAALPTVLPNPDSSSSASDFRVWQWLSQRYQLTPATLPEFFGLALQFVVASLA